MATVGQQLQRRPGGPSGSLRRPTQRSPRPRTELSENGIGDGGQQAAPAGHAADRPRSGRRGPRARELMDKEEERDFLRDTLADRCDFTRCHTGTSIRTNSGGFAFDDVSSSQARRTT